MGNEDYIKIIEDSYDYSTKHTFLGEESTIHYNYTSDGVLNFLAINSKIQTQYLGKIYEEPLDHNLLQQIKNNEDLIIKEWCSRSLSMNGYLACDRKINNEINKMVLKIKEPIEYLTFSFEV